MEHVQWVNPLFRLGHGFNSFLLTFTRPGVISRHPELGRHIHQPTVDAYELGLAAVTYPPAPYLR
jgi:hypothetical protein